MKKHLLQIMQIHVKAFTLISLIFLMGFNGYAQQAGDYRSVTGSNQNFASASTWETYNGSSWVAAVSPPSQGQEGDITIVSGSDVTYTTTGDGFFQLNADITINGDFTVNVNTNSNSNFVARTNGFILNTGGRFLADFGNNPTLTVDIMEKFVINGGRLIYSSGGNKSAIFFDIYGDAFINGGLTLNESNNQGLNNSGLYMRGTGPQHLSISSQVSELARKRFFVQSGSTNEITVSYNGSMAQNTVFGSASLSGESFTGIQNRTSNINFTVNNSSATGVKLSRNQTVDGTLRLLEGELKDDIYSLSVTDGSLIERSGGELQNPPSFGNSSVNLLYSNHTSAVTMAKEVPTTDIIQDFTISNPNGVVADRDFTINGILDLAVDNPNATNGLLELVRDYTGYAQTPYDSANYKDSTQPFNDFNSYILTMGASASTVGIGDVTGKIRRTSLVQNTTYDFGHNNTRLSFSSVGGSAIPTAVTMLVSRGDYGEHIDNSGTVEINGTTANRNTVKRLYQIRREGGSPQSRFTVRFAYQDGELNANPEADLITWDHHLPYNGVTPHEHGRTSFNSTDNYVELSNHSVFYLAENGDTTFTKYWMLSEKESEGDYVWLGAVDNTSSGTNWNVLSNWNGGRVPDETANVTIPGSNVYDVAPTINTASGYSQPSSTEVTIGQVRMRTVEIANTGVLNINGAPNIYLYGGPNEGGGGINFSTISANGSINPGESTVHLLDDATASTATISGTAAFYNLVVSDNANLDVLSDAEIEILNSFSLNTGASVDAITQPNTIRYAGTDQTITEIGGYHTLDLSSTGTTGLPATLDIYGDLLVNQSTGLNLEPVGLNFLGSTQNIESGLLSSLSLGTVTVDNTDAVTSTIASLEVSDLNLTNGGFEVASGADLILSSLLNRTNGRLGGSGTIELAGGPTTTTIGSGLFLNDVHQGNLTLNVANADFTIVDGFEVKGNLNLTEGNVPLGTQTLKIGGNLTKTNGIIDASAAVIEFTGAGSQSVASDAFIDHTVSYVKNSGAGGPNLSSELNVTDLVEVSSGTIQSNGNLKLLCDFGTPPKTAQVAELVNGSITGDVVVEQCYPARRAFRLISSSVNTSSSIRANWQEGASNYLADPNPGYGTHITGSKASETDNSLNNGFDYTPSGNPSLFQFENINRQWNPVAETEPQTLGAGVPYRLMIRGDRSIDVTNNESPPTDTRLRTTGELLIGSNLQSNLSEVADKLSIIGNPYQAQVDMHLVLTNSTNLSATEYYIWDPTLGGSTGRGAYVTIDLPSGNSSIDPNEPDEPTSANQYLQPMQAAFVRTVAEGGASINFQESFKNVSPAQTETKSLSQIEYINIQLFDADSYAEGNTPSDGLRINFNDSYSVTAKDDSPKLGNLDENLVRVEGNEYSAIERRPFPVGEEKLQLFINQYTKESYVLKFDLTSNLNTKLFIEDKYLNEIFEITKANDTYKFMIDQSVPKSLASNRFSLVLDPISLSAVDEELIRLNVYPNPTKGSFKISGQDLAQGAGVEIYNILGQQVYKRDFKGQSTIEINDFNSNTGIYLIKIETNKGKTTLKLVKE
ncbi:T9SS type A sorting domain-containing protein [Psychroflexus salinarum]|uniref:T9SS type A sorting domain-containing protein n=1 Tax=Psychroflexus salinarum TaxID=546024 RepID=A0ABW3GV70_9FLAO